jgi:hypothetical protein
VTVTLGTGAPVESVTVPVKPPVVDDWAHKREAQPHITTTRKASNAKAIPFNFIVALKCLVGRGLKKLSFPTWNQRFPAPISKARNFSNSDSVSIFE